MKISILGYGIFGSAISSSLSSVGNIIYKEEIKDSDAILVAVPSFAVVDVLLSHKNEIASQKIIICSKGFSKNGELFSEVLKKEFPNNHIYFMYGPTLAEELNSEMFSVIVLAGGEGKEELKRQIESKYFRVLLSDDVVGVQLGAALKNTVNIFIGIAEGAGFGQNTQALIYSIGLKEIQKVGVFLGANQDTFIGPSCAGDLFVRSRSRFLGIEIGKGGSYEELSKDIKYPQEGIAALKNILKINNENLDLSFFSLIHSVIFEKIPVKEAIDKLANNI